MPEACANQLNVRRGVWVDRDSRRRVDSDGCAGGKLGQKDHRKKEQLEETHAGLEAKQRTKNGQREATQK